MRAPDDILPEERAIAIAVQGIMNRAPKRDIANIMLVQIDARPIFVRQTRTAYITKTMSSPSRLLSVGLYRPDGKTLIALYATALRKWFANNDFFNDGVIREEPSRYMAYLDERCSEVSQEDVERRFSTFFTSPYQVERVTDEAIETSRELVLDAERTR